MPGQFEDYEDLEEMLDYPDDYEDDHIYFANPESGSALRAATRDNPRDQPCPSCHYPEVLTRADVALGYQCDGCANAQERGYDRSMNPDCELGNCTLCTMYYEGEVA